MWSTKKEIRILAHATDGNIQAQTGQASLWSDPAKEVTACFSGAGLDNPVGALQPKLSCDSVPL